MSEVLNLPIGDPDAAVHYSTAMFQQVQTARNPLLLMSGPAPVVSAEMPTGQSPAGFPIVKVIDLAKGTADTVQTSLMNPLHGLPVVGDEEITGKFMGSEMSRLYTRVNQLRAGAIRRKMTQHRTVHDLRTMAQKLLGEWTIRATDQRFLVALAGARGDQTLADWEIPSQTHPRFNDIMVNPVTAPTYNRRYVMNSGTVVKGGTVANVTVNDVLSLDNITDVVSDIQSSFSPLAPVVIEEDEYDWNATHVLFVPKNVWNLLRRPAALVDWKGALATTIARFDGTRKHPLFTGECIMWENTLIRPLDRYSVFFGPGSSVIEDSGSTGTYTESTVTVPTTSANFQVARCILVGAQALVHAFGAESQDSYMWRWNEEYADHKNAVEISVGMVDGIQKIKHRIAGQDTDLGVATIDVYAPPIGSAQYETAKGLA